MSEFRFLAKPLFLYAKYNKKPLWIPQRFSCFALIFLDFVGLDFFRLLETFGAKLKAVADDRQTAIKFHALFFGQIDADIVEDKIDLIRDLFADLHAFFRQNEGAFIALCLLGVTRDVSVFLEENQAARNGGLVFFAKLTKLGCRQGFFGIQIVEASDMDAA